MKDSSIILLLAAVGTAVAVAGYAFQVSQVPKLPEPICLYIDEYGYCYETRIY